MAPMRIGLEMGQHPRTSTFIAIYRRHRDIIARSRVQQLRVAVFVVLVTRSHLTHHRLLHSSSVQTEGQFTIHSHRTSINSIKFRHFSNSLAGFLNNLQIILIGNKYADDADDDDDDDDDRHSHLSQTCTDSIVVA